MIRIFQPRPEPPVTASRVPEPGRILLEDMDELIAAGEARQLLPEFDVGPTWYGKQWWVVPEGEMQRGYVLLADEKLQVEFTAQLLYLERSAEVVADIAIEREEDQRRAHSDDPAWPYERGREGRRRRRRRQ
jgi:hypothetical protein